MVSRNNGLLQLRIEGARELEDALRALGQDRLIRSTIRRALLNAGRPIAEAAQRLAPVGPNRGKPHMYDKIAVSATLSARQRRGRARSAPGEAEVYIGAGPKGPAVLVEFGTGPRRQRRTHSGPGGHGGSRAGKSTGATPAHPFMRPAWEAGKDEALRSFSRELWAQIEASARRLARRQARLIALGRQR